VAPREVAPAEEELTEHERYMRHFQARIDAINDSIAGVTAREAAGTDWTRTDRQGRRWGVSPGTIHLGDVTIPIGDSGFQAPREREEEARERARTREEIDRQEQDRQIREARDERNRRAAERRGGGGG
jgi:hypothetical protein